MPAQGRKNVHGKTGVRFKAAYTKSKYENMLRNVVTDLILKGSVKVTAAVAKDVVSAKRQAARFVRDIKGDNDKYALDVLFADLGAKYKDRNGGYTRKLKVGNRKGDDAPIVLVTWVD